MQVFEFWGVMRCILSVVLCISGVVGSGCFSATGRCLSSLECAFGSAVGYEATLRDVSESTENCTVVPLACTPMIRRYVRTSSCFISDSSSLGFLGLLGTLCDEAVDVDFTFACDSISSGGGGPVVIVVLLCVVYTVLLYFLVSGGVFFM